MRSFFGLSQTYVKSIYEQFFYMKYYGGWSLFELYALPIGLRNWYFTLLTEQKQREADQLSQTSSRRVINRG